MTVALLIENDGKRSLQLHTAAKAAKTIALSKDFRASPSRMFFHDADQDGRRELVCLTPYEKVNLLMQAGDDKFTEVELVPPGGAIAQPSYGLADLDGDGATEILVSSSSESCYLRPHGTPTAPGLVVFGERHDRWTMADPEWTSHAGPLGLGRFRPTRGAPPRCL